MTSFDMSVLMVVLLVILVLAVLTVGVVVLRALGARRRRGDGRSADDLDDSTAALLSMLHVASVVVDESGDVIRANPSAYMLGVVEDDSLVNERVRQEVSIVRETGRCSQFDVTTTTPERFSNVSRSSRGGTGAVSERAQGVTRPNWLKVTVGRIDEHCVVVLINDVSEATRFAQVRDSFIVNVSEQLLRPTQALEQLADSLESHGSNQEDIRHDAEQVRSSCHRLNRMVDDLLLLIKAQEPVLPSSANRMMLVEQLHWVVDHLRERSERAGVALTLKGDESLCVNGDRDQIRAAVSKLVENALAYSPHGGTVSILATTAQDGDHASVQVIDRGAGIAKNEQERIFERFYRGGNQRPGTEEGIGLGLAIVKHVALTHRGTVSVWSAPGQGSTFNLVLPLAR